MKADFELEMEITEKGLSLRPGIKGSSWPRRQNANFVYNGQHAELGSFISTIRFQPHRNLDELFSGWRAIVDRR